MNAHSTLVKDPTAAPDEHPQVRDVNAAHQEQLSKVELICRKIADDTGAPLALFLAVVLQLVWIIVGTSTRLDPYPFAFLLTVSNIFQLILIFIIAVGQRQSVRHDELRAESDHDSIARLLHHQEVQEDILLRLAEQTHTDVEDIKRALATLVKAA